MARRGCCGYGPPASGAESARPSGWAACRAFARLGRRIWRQAVLTEYLPILVFMVIAGGIAVAMLGGSLLGRLV